MGMGLELVEPGLTPDQELNGEVISRIFSQKTVWLLPSEVLSSRTPDIRVKKKIELFTLKYNLEVPSLIEFNEI